MKTITLFQVIFLQCFLLFKCPHTEGTVQRHKKTTLRKNWMEAFENITATALIFNVCGWSSQRNQSCSSAAVYNWKHCFLGTQRDKTVHLNLKTTASVWNQQLSDFSEGAVHSVTNVTFLDQKDEIPRKDIKRVWMKSTQNMTL